MKANWKIKGKNKKHLETHASLTIKVWCSGPPHCKPFVPVIWTGDFLKGLLHLVPTTQHSAVCMPQRNSKGRALPYLEMRKIQSYPWPWHTSAIKQGEHSWRWAGLPILVPPSTTKLLLGSPDWIKQRIIHRPLAEGCPLWVRGWAGITGDKD